MKRFAIGFLALVVVVLGGLVAFAWRPAIPGISPTAPGSFTPEQVTRGAQLAAVGGCAGCHTVAGGLPFAGGYPIVTDFGTIHSTNITPDRDTGIGTWSEVAFRRALREGVSQDGSHLFPAFPYDHFTKITDADIAALYAFFMTREPVSAEDKDNTLPFPLNIRALQAGWKLLYFRPGPLVARADRDNDWNRGAYLAEGLAHCSACHSPRNDLGAEMTSKAYSGGLLDGVVVPALTAANKAPVPWSRDELQAYFRDVSLYHGKAGGAMRPVVRVGLANLPDSDIAALAVYFAEIGNTGSRTAETAQAILRAQSADKLDLSRLADDDAKLYTATCAACHYNAPGQNNPHRPELSFVTALNADDPKALIRVILDGRPPEMPSYAAGLGDSDIARIAAYLRATRTGAAPWPDLVRQVAMLRFARLTSPLPPLGEAKP